ncbi:MAG: hypothetical protein LBM27_00115 [Lactobacillaceae bacterium]|jgi:hypothetical protein|nr:hypothetical protein [Lactobacillaceae bacterium]
MKKVTPYEYYKHIVRLNLFVNAGYHYLALGAGYVTYEELNELLESFFRMDDNFIVSANHRAILDWLGPEKEESQNTTKFVAEATKYIPSTNFAKMIIFMNAFIATYDRDNIKGKYLKQQTKFRTDIFNASAFVDFERDVMTRLFGESPRKALMRGGVQKMVSKKYSASNKSVDFPYDLAEVKFSDPRLEIMAWMKNKFEV